MEWLRRRARWLLRDEIRQVNADLAIARADALDAVLGHDYMRAQLLGYLEYGDRAAQSPCRKIPLHSEAECAEMIVSTAKDTGQDPAVFQSYPCKICPSHPIAGAILHIGHSDPELSGRKGKLARKGRNLTHRIKDPRLEQIRHRLIDDSIPRKDSP